MRLAACGKLAAQVAIPAGPLSAALNRFTEQAGKRSPGLHGEFTVGEGLNTLLRGTGLSYRFLAYGPGRNPDQAKGSLLPQYLNSRIPRLND
ncbi:hypothetical protein HML84_07795 [Alcanivorax sp. IO_7]|nr:hypothetical protein HML84_07795 [Alcanivorax sp. IO_7]